MTESKHATGDHIEQARAIHEQELGHEPDVIVLDTGAAHLEKGEYGNLKLAKDGHTVLVPQPTEDPNDPLNWSWGRKHMMLALVSLTAFLGDYGSGSGIPLIVLQGMFPSYHTIPKMEHILIVPKEKNGASAPTK
jgi:hypothetical protein